LREVVLRQKSLVSEVPVGIGVGLSNVAPIKEQIDVLECSVQALYRGSPDLETRVQVVGHTPLCVALGGRGERQNVPAPSLPLNVSLPFNGDD